MNKEVSIKKVFPVEMNGRKGCGFVYKFHRNGNLTTSHVVCFVENKRGYTLTYFCTSSLYSYLKPVFQFMVSTFRIHDTEEDLVCDDNDTNKSLSIELN